MENNYTVVGVKDAELVTQKNFGNHFDIACDEFAKLVTTMAYDQVLIFLNWNFQKNKPDDNTNIMGFWGNIGHAGQGCAFEMNAKKSDHSVN